METRGRYIWAVLRIAMGWTFLWPFLDKLFGLGFSTAPEKSWLAGGSPTTGFLKSAVGPFSNLYKSIAGSPIVDWLFMLGLLALGVALILGIGMRLASVGGVLMMLLMWSSHLPPTTNPFLDQHLIYALVLIGLAVTKAGDTLGLGKWWAKLVNNSPVLQ